MFPIEDFKHERLIRLVALVVLMPREGFYIIRCPRCGRYTFAPIRQKTRLCVYCQRIFKINPLSAVFVDDAKTAQIRVKFYQTGEHHKDFMEAVEKSRHKIQLLIPKENLDLEHIQNSKQKKQPISARRRELERILYQKAKGTPLDLQDLERECVKTGIPWEWVVQQVEALIRSGHLIARNPWQIRLVAEENTSTDKQVRKVSSVKLAQTIGHILRESQMFLSREELISRLGDEAASSSDIEEALNLLRNQGYILKTSKGTYQWIGD
jgi:hypothetical protein